MEKAYWLSRKRASLKAAQNAVGAEARLAHYDLAGRYSVKAASERADGDLTTNYRSATQSTVDPLTEDSGEAQ